MNNQPLPFPAPPSMVWGSNGTLGFKPAKVENLVEGLFRTQRADSNGWELPVLGMVRPAIERK